MSRSSQTQPGDLPLELVESVPEEVVIGGDPDQPFRLRQLLEQRLELGTGSVLVVGAVNEDLQALAGLNESPIRVDGREPHGDEPERVACGAAEPQNDPRSERKTGQGIGKTRIPRAEPLEAGVRILDLSETVAVFALAQVDATEVEAQDHTTRLSKSSGHPVDDLVVHGAAVLRVRVANENRLLRFAMFRLFE